MQALRSFEAAARTLSVSRAAEELHLTHGAVSHQVKSLEESLGCRLFERVGRGIRLTDEGERFAERVRAALAEITEAAREIMARSNPRRLKISVMPSFAARWLLPRIGRFIQGHPEIDLDVSASLALVDFSREDVDVAIRYGRGGWANVASEKILDDWYFPVVSPRYAGGRLPRHPGELPRHLLFRSESEYWRPWFLAAGVDVAEPSRGPMFNDSNLILEAVIDGQGIALARSSLVSAELRDGRLTRLFDVMIPSPNAYYLVWARRLDGASKLAAFRGWLLDEIAADPGPAQPDTRSARARASASPSKAGPTTRSGSPTGARSRARVVGQERARRSAVKATGAGRRR
jgi:LysR family glycine cleavage system transcriptional activator